MSVGKRIATFRNSAKLSVAQFSDATGISVSSVKKYEADISKPGSDAIEAIIRLGADAHWLLTGEDQSPAKTDNAKELQLLKILLSEEEWKLICNLREIEKDSRREHVTSLASDFAAVERREKQPQQHRQSGT